MAAGVLAAFAVQDCVWAGAAGPASPVPQAALSLADVILDPSRLPVPAGKMMLREWSAGTNGKLIIHLQDAHGNYQAQKNMAEALGFWMDRLPSTQLIAVEGGEGDGSLDVIRKSAPQGLWDRAAAQLLRDGLIVGEEYLNLTSDRPMKIVGVEDQKLYDANRAAYARIASARQELTPSLHRMRAAVETLKSRMYPQSALDYEADLRDTDGWDFVKRSTAISRLPSDVSALAADHPVWNKWEKLRAEEAPNEDTELASEEAAVIASLPVNHPALEQLRAGTASDPAAAVGLWASIAQAVAVKPGPRLVRYLERLKEAAAIDPEQLARDADLIEQDIYQKILTTPEASRLREMDRYLTLLEKAVLLRLDGSEMSLLRSGMRAFPSRHALAWLNRQLADHKQEASWVVYDPRVDAALRYVRKFYDLAARRDDAFIERLGSAMSADGSGSAFLIAGGYHSSRILELLRSGGYSVIMFAPVTDQETDWSSYEKVLLEKSSDRPHARLQSRSNIRQAMAATALGARLAGRSNIGSYGELARYLNAVKSTETAPTGQTEAQGARMAVDEKAVAYLRKELAVSAPAIARLDAAILGALIDMSQPNKSQISGVLNRAGVSTSPQEREAVLQAVLKTKKRLAENSSGVSGMGRRQWLRWAAAGLGLGGLIAGAGYWKLQHIPDMSAGTDRGNSAAVQAVPGRGEVIQLFTTARNWLRDNGYPAERMPVIDAYLAHLERAQLMSPDSTALISKDYRGNNGQFGSVRLMINPAAILKEAADLAAHDPTGRLYAETVVRRLVREAYGTHLLERINGDKVSFDLTEQFNLLNQRRKAMTDPESRDRFTREQMLPVVEKLFAMLTAFELYEEHEQARLIDWLVTKGLYDQEYARNFWARNGSVEARISHDDLAADLDWFRTGDIATAQKRSLASHLELGVRSFASATAARRQPSNKAIEAMILVTDAVQRGELSEKTANQIREGYRQDPRTYEPILRRLEPAIRESLSSYQEAVSSGARMSAAETPDSNDVGVKVHEALTQLMQLHQLRRPVPADRSVQPAGNEGVVDQSIAAHKWPSMRELRSAIDREQVKLPYGFEYIGHGVRYVVFANPKYPTVVFKVLKDGVPKRIIYEAWLNQALILRSNPPITAESPVLLGGNSQWAAAPIPAVAPYAFTGGPDREMIVQERVEEAEGISGAGESVLGPVRDKLATIGVKWRDSVQHNYQIKRDGSGQVVIVDTGDSGFVMAEEVKQQMIDAVDLPEDYAPPSPSQIDTAVRAVMSPGEYQMLFIDWNTRTPDRGGDSRASIVNGYRALAVFYDALNNRHLSPDEAAAEYLKYMRWHQAQPRSEASVHGARMAKPGLPDQLRHAADAHFAGLKRRQFLYTAAAFLSGAFLPVSAAGQDLKNPPAALWKPDPAEQARLLKFLSGNTFSDGTPRSFKAPSGYWKSIGSDARGGEAMIERLMVGEDGKPRSGTINIYDGALWQIWMAHNGKNTEADHWTRILKGGSIGELENIRAHQAPFAYGDTSRPASKKEAFIFRALTPYYRQTDPLDGKKSSPDFPDGTELKHADWKPITGENAWANLIGPLQSVEMKRKGAKPNADSDESALAMSLLGTIQSMQSPSGAVYHAPAGTQGKDPKDVSVENNASMYAALKMLEKTLVSTGASSEAHKRALALTREILSGMDRFWKNDAFDRAAGVFYQGGKMKSDGLDVDRTFAVDCQTWTLAVLGPERIIREIGGGDEESVIRILRETKRRAGVVDDGVLSGVGFTDGHDVISGEWTAGAIMAWRIAAGYYQNQYAQTRDERFRKWAIELWNDAESMRRGLEQLKTAFPDGSAAYLYASRRAWIPFGWWANPIPSLASTAWVAMIDSDFNPFELGGGKIPNINNQILELKPSGARMASSVASLDAGGLDESHYTLLPGHEPVPSAEIADRISHPLSVKGRVPDLQYGYTSHMPSIWARVKAPGSYQEALRLIVSIFKDAGRDRVLSGRIRSMLPAGDEISARKALFALLLPFLSGREELFFDASNVHPFSLDRVKTDRFLMSLSVSDSRIKIQLEDMARAGLIKKNDVSLLAERTEHIMTLFLKSSDHALIPYTNNLIVHYLQDLVIRLLVGEDVYSLYRNKVLAMGHRAKDELALAELREVLPDGIQAVSDRFASLQILSGIAFSLRQSPGAFEKISRDVLDPNTPLDRYASINDLEDLLTDIRTASEPRVIFYMDDVGEAAYDMLFMQALMTQYPGLKMTLYTNRYPVDNNMWTEEFFRMLEKPYYKKLRQYRDEGRLTLHRTETALVAQDPRFIIDEVRRDFVTATAVIFKGAALFDVVRLPEINAYYEVAVPSAAHPIAESTGARKGTSVFLHVPRGQRLDKRSSVTRDADKAASTAPGARPAQGSRMASKADEFIEALLDRRTPLSYRDNVIAELRQGQSREMTLRNAIRTFWEKFEGLDMGNETDWEKAVQTIREITFKTSSFLKVENDQPHPIYGEIRKRFRSSIESAVRESDRADVRGPVTVRAMVAGPGFMQEPIELQMMFDGILAELGLEGRDIRLKIRVIDLPETSDDGPRTGIQEKILKNEIYYDGSDIESLKLHSSLFGSKPIDIDHYFDLEERGYRLKSGILNGIEFTYTDLAREAELGALRTLAGAQDLVLVNNTLTYLPVSGRVAAFRALYGSLKPGGSLVLTESNKDRSEFLTELHREDEGLWRAIEFFYDAKSVSYGYSVTAGARMAGQAEDGQELRLRASLLTLLPEEYMQRITRHFEDGENVRIAGLSIGGAKVDYKVVTKLPTGIMRKSFVLEKVSDGPDAGERSVLKWVDPMFVRSMGVDTEGIRGFLNAIEHDARASAFVAGLVPTADRIGDYWADGILHTRFVEGKTLYEIRQTQQRLDALRKAADELAYLENRYGFHHGDLHGENIMVVENGDATIIDLDLARLEPPLQSGRQTIGVHPVLYKDIYSIGRLLLLTYSPHAKIQDPDIFTGQNYREQRPVNILLSRGRTLISEHDPESIPAPMLKIILKATLADPSDNYNNMSELASDLDAYMSGARMAAPPKSDELSTWVRYLHGYPETDKESVWWNPAASRSLSAFDTQIAVAQRLAQKPEVLRGIIEVIAGRKIEGVRVEPRRLLEVLGWCLLLPEAPDFDRSDLEPLLGVADPSLEKSILEMFLEPLFFKQPWIFDRAFVTRLIDAYGSDPAVRFLDFYTHMKSVRSFGSERRFRSRGQVDRILQASDSVKLVGRLEAGGIGDVLLTFSTPAEALIDRSKAPLIGTRNDFIFAPEYREDGVALNAVAPDIRLHFGVSRSQDKIYLEGAGARTHIDVDTYEGSSTHYSRIYRVLAELGLPFDFGLLNQGRVILGAADNPDRREAADLWHEKVVLANRQNRPVVVLNPFGGEQDTKGYQHDAPKSVEAFQRQVRSLLVSGFFVVVTPNHKRWGSELIASEMLEAVTPFALTEREKADIWVAPQPTGADRDRLKYLIGFADVVVTVEGGTMHLAYALGKPMIVLPFSISPDAWFPLGASQGQGMIRSDQDSGPTAKRILKRAEDWKRQMTGARMSYRIKLDNLLDQAEASIKKLIALDTLIRNMGSLEEHAEHEFETDPNAHKMGRARIRAFNRAMAEFEGDPIAEFVAKILEEAGLDRDGVLLTTDGILPQMTDYAEYERQVAAGRQLRAAASQIPARQELTESLNRLLDVLPDAHLRSGDEDLGSGALLAKTKSVLILLATLLPLETSHARRAMVEGASARELDGHLARLEAVRQIFAAIWDASVVGWMRSPSEHSDLIEGISVELMLSDSDWDRIEDEFKKADGSGEWTQMEFKKNVAHPSPGKKFAPASDVPIEDIFSDEEAFRRILRDRFKIEHDQWKRYFAALRLWKKINGSTSDLSVRALGTEVEAYHAMLTAADGTSEPFWSIVARSLAVLPEARAMRARLRIALRKHGVSAIRARDLKSDLAAAWDPVLAEKEPELAPVLAAMQLSYAGRALRGGRPGKKERSFANKVPVSGLHKAGSMTPEFNRGDLDRIVLESWQDDHRIAWMTGMGDLIRAKARWIHLVWRSRERRKDRTALDQQLIKDASEFVRKNMPLQDGVYSALAQEIHLAMAAPASSDETADAVRRVVLQNDNEESMQRRMTQSESWLLSEIRQIGESARRSRSILMRPGVWGSTGSAKNAAEYRKSVYYANRLMDLLRADAVMVRVLVGSGRMEQSEPWLDAAGELWQSALLAAWALGPSVRAGEPAGEDHAQRSLRKLIRQERILSGLWNVVIDSARKDQKGPLVQRVNQLRAKVSRNLVWPALLIALGRHANTREKGVLIPALDAAKDLRRQIEKPLIDRGAAPAEVRKHARSVLKALIAFERSKLAVFGFQVQDGTESGKISPLDDALNSRGLGQEDLRRMLESFEDPGSGAFPIHHEIGMMRWIVLQLALAEDHLKPSAASGARMAQESLIDLKYRDSSSDPELVRRILGRIRLFKDLKPIADEDAASLQDSRALIKAIFESRFGADHSSPLNPYERELFEYFDAHPEIPIHFHRGHDSGKNRYFDGTDQLQGLSAGIWQPGKERVSFIEYASETGKGTPYQLLLHEMSHVYDGSNEISAYNALIASGDVDGDTIVTPYAEYLGPRRGFSTGPQDICRLSYREFRANLWSNQGDAEFAYQRTMATYGHKVTQVIQPLLDQDPNYPRDEIYLALKTLVHNPESARHLHMDLPADQALLWDAAVKVRKGLGRPGPELPSVFTVNDRGVVVPVEQPPVDRDEKAVGARMAMTPEQEAKDRLETAIFMPKHGGPLDLPRFILYTFLWANKILYPGAIPEDLNERLRTGDVLDLQKRVAMNRAYPTLSTPDAGRWIRISSILGDTYKELENYGGLLKAGDPEASAPAKVKEMTRRVLDFYRQVETLALETAAGMSTEVERVVAMRSLAAQNRNEPLISDDDLREYESMAGRWQFNSTIFRSYLQDEPPPVHEIELSAWLGSLTREGVLQTKVNPRVPTGSEQTPFKLKASTAPARIRTSPELLHLLIERVLSNGFHAKQRQKVTAPAVVRVVPHPSKGFVRIQVVTEGVFEREELLLDDPRTSWQRIISLNAEREETSHSIGMPTSNLALRRISPDAQIRFRTFQSRSGRPHVETSFILPMAPAAARMAETPVPQHVIGPDTPTDLLLQNEPVVFVVSDHKQMADFLQRAFKDGIRVRNAFYDIDNTLLHPVGFAGTEAFIRMLVDSAAEFKAGKKLGTGQKPDEKQLQRARESVRRDIYHWIRIWESGMMDHGYHKKVGGLEGILPVLLEARDLLNIKRFMVLTARQKEQKSAIHRLLTTNGILGQDRLIRGAADVLIANEAHRKDNIIRSTNEEARASAPYAEHEINIFVDDIAWNAENVVRNAANTKAFLILTPDPSNEGVTRAQYLEDARSASQEKRPGYVYESLINAYWRSGSQPERTEVLDLAKLLLINGVYKEFMQQIVQADKLKSRSGITDEHPIHRVPRGSHIQTPTTILGPGARMAADLRIDPSAPAVLRTENFTLYDLAELPEFIGDRESKQEFLNDLTEKLARIKLEALPSTRKPEQTDEMYRLERLTDIKHEAKNISVEIERLRNNGGGFRLATDRTGRIIGFGMFWIHDRSNGRIEHLYVLPDSQRKGIGLGLMSQMLAALKKSGATNAEWTSTADAIGRYQRILQELHIPFSNSPKLSNFYVDLSGARTDQLAGEAYVSGGADRPRYAVYEKIAPASVSKIAGFARIAAAAGLTGPVPVEYLDGARMAYTVVPVGKSLRSSAVATSSPATTKARKPVKHGYESVLRRSEKTVERLRGQLAKLGLLSGESTEVVLALRSGLEQGAVDASESWRNHVLAILTALDDKADTGIRVRVDAERSEPNLVKFIQHRAPGLMAQEVSSASKRIRLDDISLAGSGVQGEGGQRLYLESGFWDAGSKTYHLPQLEAQVLFAAAWSRAGDRVEPLLGIWGKMANGNKPSAQEALDIASGRAAPDMVLKYAFKALSLGARLAEAIAGLRLSTNMSQIAA